MLHNVEYLDYIPERIVDNEFRHFFSFTAFGCLFSLFLRVPNASVANRHGSILLVHENVAK